MLNVQANVTARAHSQYIYLFLCMWKEIFYRNVLDKTAKNYYHI